LFEAASAIGRFRQESRPSPGANSHPDTRRTYLLRSYLFCHLCGRRMYGMARRRYTYYRCEVNAHHHGHLPWYPNHPRSILVKEDRLIEPIARFFTQRVFGPSRKILLADCQPPRIAKQRSKFAETH
jgi:site-specific DNA recombinase